MKKLLFGLTLLFTVSAAVPGAFAQEKTEKAKSKKVETMTCWASMDCESCKAKVEKNIAFEKGVKDLKVDLEKNLVTISYRTDKTNPEKLEKAIQDLGYKTEIVPNPEKKEAGKEKK